MHQLALWVSALNQQSTRHLNHHDQFSPSNKDSLYLQNHLNTLDHNDGSWPDIQEGPLCVFRTVTDSEVVMFVCENLDMLTATVFAHISFAKFIG